MVRSGTTETLVGLLSHENTDIVIDVVEVVHELTDEDVGDEDVDVDEDDENKEAPLKTLIDGLVGCFHTFADGTNGLLMAASILNS